MNILDLRKDIAKQAMDGGWPSCHAAPQEIASPAGTVDWARTEHDAHWRIWCADGTCRSVPDEIAESAGMSLAAIPQWGGQHAADLSARVALRSAIDSVQPAV